MRKGQKFETFFASPSELDIMITMDDLDGARWVCQNPDYNFLNNTFRFL